MCRAFENVWSNCEFRRAVWNASLNFVVLNTIFNAPVSNIVVLTRYFYIYSAILTTRHHQSKQKRLWLFNNAVKIKRRPTQVFMQSGRRFLPDLNQNWISSANFYGSRHTKFHGNLPSGNRGDKTRNDGLKKERINRKRKKESGRTWRMQQLIFGTVWTRLRVSNGSNQLNYSQNCFRFHYYKTDLSNHSFGHLRDRDNWTILKPLQENFTAPTSKNNF